MPVTKPIWGKFKKDKLAGRSVACETYWRGWRCKIYQFKTYFAVLEV